MIHRLVEEQAQARPEAQALAGFGGNLSYRKLDSRANQLAHFMAARGVTEGTFVRIFLPRSIDFVSAILAVLKLGAAYVPLEPSYPSERLAFLVADLDCRLTITNRELRARLPHAARGVVCLDEHEREIRAGSQALQRPPPDDTAVAVVLYTSGSTGKPKGVMLHHRGLVDYLLWERATYGHGPGDRVLQQCSLSFDFSLWEIFTALANGGCLVLPRPLLHFEGRYLVQFIQDEQVTTVGTSPSLLSVIVDVPGFAHCSSLRKVFAGGEVLTCELQQRFFSRNAARLINIYGPTEATISATHWECSREAPDGPVPIGYPVSGARVYLLDQERKAVPDGAEGEIYIGGSGVGLGYYNRDALTRERFVEDTFSISSEPAARLYRTGDRGRRLPNGAFAYLGRFDNQVKLHGLRIELEEVEAALRLCPGVKECVATLTDHERGNRKLAAFYVRTGTEECSQRALRAGLQSKLPAYMIPSVFVAVDELPLTPNGKIDRHNLPPIEIPAGDAHEIPASDTERLLAEIWAEVLGIARPGVTADFFEVGGDSLACLEVSTRIEQQTGIRFPLSLMFVATTIREQAARLDSGRTEDEDVTCVTLARGGDGPTLVLVSSPGSPLQRFSGLVQNLPGIRILGMASPVKPVDAVATDMVQGIARQLTEVLLELAPEGELVIAGFSAGGLVSLEMAHSLQTRGRRVEKVILLDSATPPVIHRVLSRGFAGRVRDTLCALQKRDWTGRKDFLLEIAAKLGSRIRQEWDSRLRCARASRASKSVLDDRRTRAPLEENKRSAIMLLFELIKDHKVAPYHGRVVLVRARDQSIYGFGDSSLGWNSVLPQALEIRTVPGSHDTMFHGRHVHHLAAMVSHLLGHEPPATR